MIDTIQTHKEGTAYARARMEGNPDIPILSSGPLGWNGMIAERYLHAPMEHHFPPFPENTASLYLGQTVNSVRWSGDGIHEGPTKKGDVTVKTSGQPVGWHFDKDVDLLVMRFAPAFLSRVAEENDLNPDAVELRPSLDQRDDAVEHIGLAMLAEMESGGVGGRVYGDALATALSTHLLRNHGTSSQTVSDQKGGLPRNALRRVTDFVNDNLSMDLGLSEMAGVANLSRYHFSRQFKRSTGLSPHQYVIGRRVERARELLSSTDLSVGDVASVVGFTHQSHLAYHTRRRFGVPPSTLRR
ncbi:MAG: Transcriptional regulator, AraC family [uncultured Rubrobacteraceae bacterium]|uniref:Transcriptional regulator, AraC family n=1 Tax=uncultured Rubrobacteraceae bacterium TaxID=349277 RepID=A0A6J4PVZ6_9ACTN|nr:MAG: Transcriptional regulator, AraC family [uncultured Rubrobacteraceae bacterium]